MGLKKYTESSLRSKLYRRGYSLCTWKDAYGAKGYVVADSNSTIVYGGEYCLLDLDDIAEWIEWLDAEKK